MTDTCTTAPVISTQASISAHNGNGTIVPDILRFAPFLQAYTECSDELQAHARAMIAILTDPNTDMEERELSAMTLADILFPNGDELGSLKGCLGMDLEEAERQGAYASEETRATLEQMDKEEATFADRLTAIMFKRDITQARLAELIGVGQPAISMMLARQCRPQKRTIEKLAKVLEVSPEELWP